MTSAISSGCDARRIGVVSPQRGDERGAPGASLEQDEWLPEVVADAYEELVC